MSNWRDDEIRELLSVRADVGIVRQIQGTARDSVVYDQITNRLRERGVIRTKAQVNSKLKALKRQYHHHVVDHNGRSANDRKAWCYFSLCEAIWGSSHSTNPVALVGSMETAPISRGPETPPHPTSSCMYTAPYSDTEEQTPVHETDLSMNDSGLSTASSGRSPPKKKRRSNQTRLERLSAEMRAMFSEMDANFEERERLRLLEKREYEERVRREARVEKAQEMAILQDMTSLLRQMVQRMPATQPQCPHPCKEEP